MVQVDVFLAGAIGACVALAGRSALRQEPSWLSGGPFAANALLTLTVVVPCLLFFLSAWPQWDTMYALSSSTETPAWLVPLFSATAGAAQVTGFHLVHRALRAQRDRVAWAMPVAWCVPALVVCVAWPERWLHFGTAESFRAGGAFNVLQSPVPVALVVVSVLIGVPVLLLARRYSAPA